MKRTIAVFAAVLAMAACTKKGSQGPAGANGTNGANGNANVAHALATILPSEWSWDTTGKYNYIDIQDFQITQNIVDSGSVSVFVSTDESVWQACPYTFWGNPSESFTFGYMQNEVELQVSNTSSADLPPSTFYVKIIAITATQRRANPHTDWHNYEQAIALASPVAPATVLAATR